MIFVGIDPGLTGGIAWIDQGKSSEVYSTKLDGMTERDVWQLIARFEPAVVVLEKVHGGPKMGSSAAFKFGKSYGSLHMAVICAGLPLQIVTPQKWQQEFGLIMTGRGITYGDREKKKRNKAKAQELFPEIKVIDAIADALLLAAYCKRKAEHFF